MEVEGAAFLVQKESIIKNHGENQWLEFVKKLGVKDNFFNDPHARIGSRTLIPLDKFLFFMDELLKEFYVKVSLA